MNKSVLLVFGGLVLLSGPLAAGEQLASQAAMSAPASGAAVGNAAAGKQKAFMCKGCHNNQGYKTAYPKVYEVPRLGGQHAEYIVSALGQYRSGERSFQTMRSMAASLSDQDIADLAAYYSSAN